MAKASILSRVKDWFTGKSSSSKKAKKESTQPRVQNQSVNVGSSGSNRTYISPAQKSIDDSQKKKEQYSTKQWNYNYKKAELPVKVNRNNQELNRANNRARLKSSQKYINAKQEQLKKSQAESVERGKKTNKYEEAMGLQGKTRYEKKLEQKIGGIDTQRKQEEYMAKNHRKLYAVGRGIEKSAGFGMGEILEEKYGDKELNKIKNEYKKSQTKGEKALEIGAGFATDAMQFGGSEGVAKAILNKGARKGVSKAVTKGLVNKFGEKAGKAMADEFIAGVASDATVGNIAPLLKYATSDKSDEEKNTELAIDEAVNLGANLLPLGGSAFKHSRAGKYLAEHGKAILSKLKNGEALEEAEKQALEEFKKYNVTRPEKKLATASKGKEVVEEAPKVDSRFKRNKLADNSRLVGRETYMGENVGYHAGSFNKPQKAESYGNFAGSRRGTGHFGTGTYIAGAKDVLDDGGHYGGRPLNKIDFDGYNMYKPLDHEEGIRIHDSLSKLNNDIGTYRASQKYDFNAIRDAVEDGDYTALKEFADDNVYDAKYRGDFEAEKQSIRSKSDEDYLKKARYDRALEEVISDMSLDEILFTSEREIDRRVEELLKNYDIEKNLAEDVKRANWSKEYDRTHFLEKDEDEYVLEQIAENLDKHIERFEQNKNLKSKFVNEVSDHMPDKSIDEIEEAFDKTIATLEEYEKSGVDLYKVDSPSTVFMKNLGYDGIDVRHIDTLDNTRYGSVIYDIDKSRVKQIPNTNRQIKNMPTPLGNKAEMPKAEPPKSRVNNPDKKLASATDGLGASDARQELKDIYDELANIRETEGEEAYEQAKYEASAFVKNLEEIISDNGRQPQRLTRAEKVTPPTAKVEAPTTKVEPPSTGNKVVDDIVDTKNKTDYAYDPNEKMPGIDTTPVEQEAEHAKTIAEQTARAVPKEVNIKELNTKGLHEGDNYVDVMTHLAKNPDQLSKEMVQNTDFSKIAKTGVEDVDNTTKVLDDWKKALNSGDKEEADYLESEIKNRLKNSNEQAEYYAKQNAGKKTYDADADKILDAEELMDACEKLNAERDFIKSEDLLNIRKGVEIENAGLKGFGKRISNTFVNFLSRTQSEQSRELLKQYRGKFIFDISNQTQKFEEATKVVLKDPTAVMRKLRNTLETGELPNRKDLENVMWQAQALASYCDMFRNSIPDEAMRKQFQQGYMTAVDYCASMGNIAGKISVSQRFFKHLSFDARALATEKQLRKYFKAIGIDGLDYDTLPPQAKETFDALLKGISSAKSVDEVEMLSRQAMDYASKITPRSFSQVLNKWRYFAMLCSPKTHIKNRLGNEVMFAKSLVDDTLAGAMQKAGGIEAGSRTKSASVLSDTFSVLSDKNHKWRKLIDEDIDADISVLMHDSEKFAKINGNSDVVLKMVDGEPKLVSTNKIGRMVDKLSDIVGDSLEHSDEKLMRRNYMKAYAEVLSANGYDNLDEVGKAELRKFAREEAQREALERTYRDKNKTADLINELVKQGKRRDASLGQKVTSVAINTAMPFTNTPMNMAKASIKNTPVGMAMSVNKFLKAKKAGDTVAMARALGDVAQGTSGSGLMLLGMYLGTLDEEQNGYITTSAGDDAIAKNNRDLGFQDYSIKIGDSTYTLDALDPLITSVFVGAEIGNTLFSLDGGDGEGTFFDKVSNVARVNARLISPLMEMSMMQGLNSVLDGASNDSKLDGLTNVAQALAVNYVNSLRPAALRQLGKATQEYDYMNVTRSDSESARLNERTWGNIKNTSLLARPFLDKDEIGAKTNVHGEVTGEKNNALDYAMAIGKNMLSPTSKQKIIKDDVDKELQRVYSATADPDDAWGNSKGLLNHNSYQTSMTVGNGEYGTKLELSNKNISEYNQSKKEAGYDAVMGALQSQAFNKTDVRMSDEEKQAFLDGAPKDLQGALRYVMNSSQYKNSSDEGKAQIIKAMMGKQNGGKQSGWARTGGKLMYQKNGLTENQFVFDSDATEGQKKKLLPAIEKGIFDNFSDPYEPIVQFEQLAGHEKFSDSEDDEYNGRRSYHYRKADMLNAFNEMDLTEEQKEALFNSHKYGNTKPYYTGMTAGGGGYRRGYRRDGGGGGRKGKVASNSGTVKASASNYNYKKAPTTKATRLTSMSSSQNSVVNDAYIQRILNQVKEK